MPIITCPDCGHHPVSDRAPTCPKCGCPIALANVSSGSPSGPVAVSSQSDGNQAIAQLELMVKEAQRELLTADQAEAVARRIAEFKRTAFSSREAFVEASVANRILVLSDEDVDILKSLDADQRSRIKALYALGCDRIDGTMVDCLKGFRNLAILDHSYTNGLAYQEMKTAFNHGADLSVLQNLYLRRNRRLQFAGLSPWLLQATQLEGLYVDGSTDTLLNIGIFARVACMRSMRTLSVQGCSQLAGRDSLSLRQEIVRLCPQLRVIGP
jgi:hypothetical protein